jgi:hypothetical protein
MTPILTSLANLQELQEAAPDALRPVLAHSKHLSAQTEEGLQYLIKALAFADANFASEIENLLVNAGGLAVPHLIHGLHSPDVAVASTCAMALVRLNTKAETALHNAYLNVSVDAEYRWRFDFVMAQLGLDPAAAPDSNAAPRLAVVK